MHSRWSEVTVDWLDAKKLNQIKQQIKSTNIRLCICICAPFSFNLWCFKMHQLHLKWVLSFCGFKFFQRHVAICTRHSDSNQSPSFSLHHLHCTFTKFEILCQRFANWKINCYETMWIWMFLVINVFYLYCHIFSEMQCN